MLWECLMKHHREDTMGLVVRSRCHGQAEAEVDSIYPLNQEIKSGKRGQRDKLYKKVDKLPNAPPSKILLEDRSQVESEAVGFFTNLLQGFHQSSDVLGDSPFQPDFPDLENFLQGLGKLTPEQAGNLTKEVS